MRVVREVRQVGTALPMEGADLTVQKYPSGTLVASGTTDDDGLGEVVAQGSPGLVRERASRGSAVYDEYSANMGPVGKTDLSTLQLRLANTTGDGIIGTYGDNFAYVIGAGTLTVGTGGVLLDGIIAIFRSPTTISVANGDRALVAVLSGDAVSLAEIAYSAIVSGTHVPIYRYTVSGGNVSVGTVQGIGSLIGGLGRNAVIGITRAASGNVESTTGEPAGLDTTLALGSGTYDIWAKASLLTDETDTGLAIEIEGNLSSYRSTTGDISTRLHNSHNRSGFSGASALVRAYDRNDQAGGGPSGWVLQQTVNGTGAPGGVFTGIDDFAVDGSGNIFICDTTEGYVYKYNSLGVLQATKAMSWDPITTRRNATGDYLYTITSLDGLIAQEPTLTAGVVSDTDVFSDTSYDLDIDPSDGTIWASGQVSIQRASFNGASFVEIDNWVYSDPVSNLFSLCVDATYVYVYDSHAANPKIWKVAKTDPATTVTSWGGIGTGNGQFSGTDTGFNKMSVSQYDGTIWITDYGNDRVQQFSTTGTYLDQFSVTDPSSVQQVANGDVWVMLKTANTLNRYRQEGGSNWESGLLVAVAVPR